MAHMFNINFQQFKHKLNGIECCKCSFFDSIHYIIIVCRRGPMQHTKYYIFLSFSATVAAEDTIYSYAILRAMCREYNQHIFDFPHALLHKFAANRTKNNLAFGWRVRHLMFAQTLLTIYWHGFHRLLLLPSRCQRCAHTIVRLAIFSRPNHSVNLTFRCAQVARRRQK